MPKVELELLSQGPITLHLITMAKFTFLEVMVEQITEELLSMIYMKLTVRLLNGQSFNLVELLQMLEVDILQL